MKVIKVTLLALVLTAATSWVLAAWQAPLLAPPACNPSEVGCYSPLNVSAVRQEKRGQLGIGILTADDWRNQVKLLVKDEGTTVGAGAIYGWGTSGNSVGVTGESPLAGIWGIGTGASGRAVWATQSGGGFGVYQDEGSGVTGRSKNYFAGKIGVGTTDPQSMIDVFGGDVCVDVDSTGPIARKCLSAGGTGGTFWADDNSDGSINNTNPNNVGIGTTNPSVKLMVTDGSAVTLAKGSGFFQVGDDASPLNQNLVFDWSSIQSRAADGTAKSLSLNPAGGNVGIGSTNPQNKLDVAGKIQAQGDVCGLSGPGQGGQKCLSDIGASPGGTPTLQQVTTSGNNTGDRVFIHGPGVGDDSGYSGRLVITNPAASGQYLNLIRAGNFGWSLGTVYNTNNFGLGPITTPDSNFTNPSLTIRSDGNVGVGTADPQAKLDVNGSGWFQGGIGLPNGATIASAGRLHITGDENIYLLPKGGKAFVSNAWGGNGDLVVSGNLGVGIENPTDKLVVRGNITSAQDISAAGDVCASFGNSQPRRCLSQITGGGAVTGVTSITAGPGIAISQPTGNVTISNMATDGVAQIIAGNGISVSPAGGTGVVTIASTGSACSRTVPVVDNVYLYSEITAIGWPPHSCPNGDTDGGWFWLGPTNPGLAYRLCSHKVNVCAP